LLGFYNYTVILTYLGALSALTGSFLAITGHIKLSVIMLLAAGFCDMLDGWVAKTLERTQDEKRFGIQIDSLSDMVSFGVLPAVVVYCSGGQHMWQIVLVCAYTLAALIRLAYFNVLEEERQKEETGRRKYYRGLPVTTIAISFPLLYCFRKLLGSFFPSAGAILLAVSAFLFLLDFPLKKPGLRGMIVMGVCGLAMTFALILFA